MTDSVFRDKAFPGFTLLLLSSLYFSQGLPSGFLAHALPALLRENDVPVEYIGLLKLLALPWFLKFLWAPFVDRTEVGALGARRGWIILMQSILALLLLSVAFFPPASLSGGMVIGFFLIVILINTCAATQDVAADGLAVKYLPEQWRGLGNSIQVSGFKLGMILSGSLLLVSVDKIGWTLSFQLLAGAVIILLVPTFLFNETKRSPQGRECTQVESEAGWLSTYRGFFTQKKMLYWLFVLLTYKIADSFGSAMIKPLLVDSGFTLTQVAEVTFWSSISGLAGALLAGVIYYRIGAQWSLLSFGLLQAVGIGAYTLLGSGDSPLTLSSEAVFTIALFEQAADGMSTVALFALMMAQCRKGYEGTDYTVQASILVIVAGVAGALSGFFAKVIGYELLFQLAGLLGLLALIPAIIYFKKTPVYPKTV